MRIIISKDCKEFFESFSSPLKISYSKPRLAKKPLLDYNPQTARMKASRLSYSLRKSNLSDEGITKEVKVKTKRLNLPKNTAELYNSDKKTQVSSPIIGDLVNSNDVLFVRMNELVDKRKLVQLSDRVAEENYHRMQNKKLNSQMRKYGDTSGLTTILQAQKLLIPTKNLNLIKYMKSKEKLQKNVIMKIANKAENIDKIDKLCGQTLFMEEKLLRMNELNKRKVQAEKKSKHLFNFSLSNEIYGKLQNVLNKSASNKGKTNLK